MILDLLFGGDIRGALISLLMWLPVILLSLSVHEAAHGWAANKLGDPTARNFGRITLNPVKHIDPIGFLAMLLLGFGWAKPVPVNARNFNNPRKGMALTALAGPASNLLLALISAFLSASVVFIANIFAINGIYNETVVYYVWLFFYYSVYLNVALAIFNFIPVPPLDGSRILSVVLPPKYYFGIMKYERYIGIGFMVLVIVLARVFNISVISWITNPVTEGILWLFETPFNLLFRAIWKV